MAGEHERWLQARLHIATARKTLVLLERRCPNCDGLMGEYQAPIKLYWQKCRHCGLYSELSTETPGDTG